MSSLFICFSNGPPLPRTKGKGQGLALPGLLFLGRVRYAVKAEVTKSFIFKPSMAALAFTFLKRGSGISSVVFIHPFFHKTSFPARFLTRIALIFADGGGSFTEANEERRWDLG